MSKEINQEAVDYHLSQLNEHFGKQSFETAFLELKADRRVRGPEAAASASEFVSKTSKYAKKGDSLARIYRRNKDSVADREYARIAVANNRNR